MIKDIDEWLNVRSEDCEEKSSYDFSISFDFNVESLKTLRYSKQYIRLRNNPFAFSEFYGTSSAIKSERIKILHQKHSPPFASYTA